jgi:hypothetical protein
MQEDDNAEVKQWLVISCQWCVRTPLSDGRLVRYLRSFIYLLRTGCP